MIILDEPYASVPLLDWMEASAHPVLTNEFTEKLTAGGRALNLVDAAECARRLEAGERIYTNSENALAWILDHVENPTLTDAIRLFKDKAAMREKLAPLSPGLFHETVDRAGLEAVNVADLPLPVVLKPSVGFCSMGVYVIEEPERTGRPPWPISPGARTGGTSAIRKASSAAASTLSRVTSRARNTPWTPTSTRAAHPIS